MEDLTLKSELFNNIKFNMQKLILDVPGEDYHWLSGIFSEPEQEIEKLICQLKATVTAQAQKVKEQAAVPQPVKKCRIAFVGDSITSDRTSYLNILKELYKDEDKLTFIDAAVSGDKSDDAVMKFYVRTLNYEPDVVHILIGTNDLRHNSDCRGGSCISLNEYKKNLEYMLGILQEKSIPAVISQISPVINERLQKRFPEDHWSYDYKEISQLNQVIQELAEQYGAKLNPMEKIYAEYEPGELLFQDGLHLNEKGQYLLTVQVLKCLEEFIM